MLSDCCERRTMIKFDISSNSQFGLSRDEIDAIMSSALSRDLFSRGIHIGMAIQEAASMTLDNGRVADKADVVDVSTQLGYEPDKDEIKWKS